MHQVDVSHELPEYASALDAAHRAHAAELRQIICDLALTAGQCVLDLPCGDGAYTALLAEQVGLGGIVVGVDSSTGYLEIAKFGGTRPRSP